MSSAIYVGPTIFAAIAFGCANNMIMFRHVARKERWAVPELMHGSAPPLLGKLGLIVSMTLGAFAAGWWCLLLVPVGGLFFAGSSTAVWQSRALLYSTPLAFISSAAAAIWLLLR